MGVLTIEEMKKKIEHKHVLLDANVLIEAYQSPDKFTDLIEFLIASHCQPVIISLVQFEISRNIFQPELIEAHKAYLAVWNFITLPLKEESDLLRDALKIARYYAARKINNVSLADCFIASFLKKYKTNLYLITRNHKDFPAPLFVRDLVWTVDMPRDVVTFGFYRFDESQLA